jgi:hypothetical protein
MLKAKLLESVIELSQTVSLLAQGLQISFGMTNGPGSWFPRPGLLQ